MKAAMSVGLMADNLVSRKVVSLAVSTVDCWAATKVGGSAAPLDLLGR